MAARAEGDIVSLSQFFTRIPKPPPKKKKEVDPFFLLIQHTSAVLYAEFQITTLILVMYRVKYGRYVRMVKEL